MTCDAAYGGLKPYWNQNAQDCEVACPSETPAVAEGKTCQTCSNLNASTPYWNQATAECVSKCPETTYNSMCKTCYEINQDEPYWDSTIQKCIACSDKFPEKTLWDPLTNQCTDTCSREKQYDDKIICYECEDYEFWNGDECVSCPDDLPQWDYDLKRCVERCPKDKPESAEGMCVDCSFNYFGNEGYSLWNPNTNSCVDYCPDTAPLLDEYRFCRTCMEMHPDKPFWTGFECVACTEIVGGEYFDGIKCVQECPELYDGKFCKTCADANPDKPIWDGSACVACPEE